MDVSRCIASVRMSCVIFMTFVVRFASKEDMVWNASKLLLAYADIKFAANAIDLGVNMKCGDLVCKQHAQSRVEQSSQRPPPWLT